MQAEFANSIMEDRVVKIAAANEKLLWVGDTSLTGASNANVNKIDGIVKQITGTSGTNVTSASTGTTIVEKLQSFFLSQPVDVRSQEDFRICIGEDVYAEYKIALAAKNIYQPTDDMTLFGTTAKLFVTSGLNGSRKVIGVRWNSLQLGLDGDSDAEKATLEYSIETKQFYMDFAYALGVAVVWPNEAKHATV